MVASRIDSRPISREARADRKNAVAVAAVVAMTKGRLFSSSNGVLDMILKNSAGSDTYSRKKFIQLKPASGRFLSLPQANPMKIKPKYGSARLRTSIMGGVFFLVVGPGRISRAPNSPV